MHGIGIAGSGRVARPFVARLRAAGILADAFGLPPLDGAAGDTSEADVSAFAHGLRCLILTPRDIAESEALLFEEQAFAKRCDALETIVIAATLSPRYVRALRARIADRIALIDAPFTGTLRAAEDGRLSFFLGGRDADIRAAAPIFDHLGRRATRMGAFGAAMAAKVMNDCLAASSTAMTRIALDWAEAQGIDEAQLLEMTGGTLGGLIMPGYDMIDFGATQHSGEESVTALVRDVENALDAALAGAHLNRPRAIDDVSRGMKSRALH